MKKLLFAAMLAVGAVAIVPPATAQIAAAIGKPLPSPDLPPGTVSVRIVAGSPSAPVNGTDVTLLVNGTPRVARSDAAGRAIFKDLPADATVQAKVVDEDKKEITSESFPLPSGSGVRVMLTTKPWNPGAGGAAGGAPFAGGAAPEPRQMSGEPRPEQADAPGTYTVRLTYDDFKDAPPVGVPVTLVGYHADDKVDVHVVTSDKEGRAQFTGLDRTGATSYFAMAQLPRGKAIDRLVSEPKTLDPQVGMRLILSSAKRSSTDPQIDDLGRIEKQDPPTPAGKVRISLEGVPAGGAEVELVALDPDGAHHVIAHAAPEVAPPDATDIKAGAQFANKPDVPIGTIDVAVHGGQGQDNEPLKDVTVKITSASDPGATIESKTADAGSVRIAMKPAKDLVASVTINGKSLSSKPFDLTKQGGVLEVEAHWPSEGKPEAMFDVAPQRGQVVFAETTMRGQLYRSVPFQPVDGVGAHVSLFVYPRLMFSFSLTSHVDDEFLAVSGRFDVINNSWAPYVGGPDGMIVPLPKHFKGPFVAERDQADVAVAQGEGYRIVRPIPPGERQFHGAFSLPVEDGKVEWSLDLPFGAFQSGLEILEAPGMDVQLPPGVNGQTMKVPQGTFFVLPQITIMPKQAMVMSISGLPSAPSWTTWVPRVIGLSVVAVMLGGLGLALRGRGTASRDVTRAARRSQLLDELVELDRSGKNEKRREAVLAELESLWD